MKENDFKSVIGSLKTIFGKTDSFEHEQTREFKDTLKELSIKSFDKDVDAEIIRITESTNGIKNTYYFKTDKIEKYDVIVSNIGPCAHFCAVYKVVDDIVYVISISSKSKLNGIEINDSKMFKGGYFIPYIYPVSLQNALSHFCFRLDNKKEFDNVIKVMKKNYSNLIK